MDHSGSEIDDDMQADTQEQPEGTGKKTEEDYLKETEENAFILFYKEYKTYIIAVAAVLAVIILAAVLMKACGSKDSGSDADTTVIDIQTDETEAAAAELSSDGYPEINELVEAYFEAMENCDIDALAKLVASTESISYDQLVAEKEFVESYDNIICYTLPGLISDTYITYVSYDMKFVNIETAAPCMIRMYICTNDEGSLYINNQDVDTEVAAYMEEINTRDDVKALIASVDEALTAAMAEDEDLNALVAKLQGEDDEETEETTEADAEETTEAEEEEASSAEENTESEETDSSGETTAADSEEETEAEEDITFTEVSETVYAMQNVRLRATPSSDGEIVGVLIGGEAVKRTGVSDEWSRVIYDGEVCYVATEYLTTIDFSED